LREGAESAETSGMGTETTSVLVHPEGEPPEVEAWSAVADTYAGRVHVEWDATAPVTPFGQLPFFIEYLKQGGLFDSSPLGRSRWFCGSVAATYWLVGSAPEICQLSHVRRDKAARFQRVQAPPGDRSSRKRPEQAWR
jgi:hypothetical protein